MKLQMIMGLLLAGSLFVGTAIQAQDGQDATEELLNAIDRARATAETAETERERQKAEQDVAELESSLEDLTTQALPSSTLAVSVECNGGCDDNTLGQICSLAGAGRIPIGIACNDVADRNSSDIACPGSGDNRCSIASFSSGTRRLNTYCQDSSGWDAVVLCALP